MEQASSSERDYFRRIAIQNSELPHGNPPKSLLEMFERLESIKLHAGELSEAGQPGTDTGDLQSHLDYLKRLRNIDHSYGT